MNSSITDPLIEYPFRLHSNKCGKHHIICRFCPAYQIFYKNTLVSHQEHTCAIGINEWTISRNIYCLNNYIFKRCGNAKQLVYLKCQSCLNHTAKRWKQMIYDVPHECKKLKNVSVGTQTLHKCRDIGLQCDLIKVDEQATTNATSYFTRDDIAIFEKDGYRKFYDNHFFKKNSFLNATAYYRCFANNCKATLLYKNDQYKQRNKHSHEPDKAIFYKIIFYNLLRSLTNQYKYILSGRTCWSKAVETLFAKYDDIFEYPAAIRNYESVEYIFYRKKKVLKN